ncbi:hyaluronidase-1 [Python bivittatus]|uniref:Hyaluronidase n=1 Tax=Python bivittatus TaxID=176946 RepID=A0A9F5IXA1_PYTBI|nr:hyaluronidase-1 [Python bivittatus]XP_025022438.1 hyaluronidase-1 [Python bivittatus]XP_025022439.1 hyaluronidase-1 [Python bivittatus]
MAMSMEYLTSWICLLNVFLMVWNHDMTEGAQVILDSPFISVWNAPTQICQDRYGISLDLRIFDLIVNQNDSFMGKDITLFYSNKFGYYPYYTKDGVPIYGGLPQNASLKDNLQKIEQDIKNTILDVSFRGLAVVDWEHWRPLWIRNWDSLKIYQNKSIELVKEQHPDWPADKVIKEAQLAFQQSARAFMEQTLAYSETLRPKGFWGFYGFPDCYNNDYHHVNYTGECPEIEKQRNNKLQWLWKQSWALYPSIYLPEELRLTSKTLEFARHRIQEAFRVLNWTQNDIPVLPYTTIIYEFTQNFITQEDLVHTIGESASQGAAGVIIWGSTNLSHSWETCLQVKEYVDTLLGPYIMNVTSSTKLCSEILCSNNGRCVRGENYPNAFLHLSSASFTIKKHNVDPGFILIGQMSMEDQVKMAQEFTCQCYNGWTGLQCEKKSI